MKLDDVFLEHFRSQTPDMDAVGLVTFLRTYSAKSSESWFDVCKRVVEGAWTIAERCNPKGADAEHMQTWGQRMFRSMFAMQWIPAGRGLQHMGHPRMWVKGSAVLQNCAYVDSKDPDWIGFLANMSMLGVGVGFDASAAGTKLHRPSLDKTPSVIADTREGWVGVFGDIYAALLAPKRSVPATIDLSGLRKRGVPLKTMGGVSSGPDPLGFAVAKFCNVTGLLGATYDPDTRIVTVDRTATTTTTLTSEMILDMGNIVGVCVVSGGIRRSAEIALFDVGDNTPFVAKQDHDKLMSHRWASNNTVRFYEPPSREDIAKLINNNKYFGDPGMLFVYNSIGFGRTGDSMRREVGHGCNPCVTGDTLVRTTAGEFTVDSLIGKQFSFTFNGRTWLSMPEGFFESKRTNKLVRVWFDDGTHLKCTPDHKLITTRGPIAAKKLRTGAHGLNMWDDDRVIVHTTDCGWKQSKKVVQVEKVKPAAAVPVYDCQIPGLNAFPANGVIIANCGEQPLESLELCNLSELCLPRCKDYAAFEEAARCAFYYSKLVTMLPVGHKPTDAVMQRNRRIGVSVTGFAEDMSKAAWFSDAYSTVRKFDNMISARHNVPTSVKITSVKPSGTVSLVLGCAPGMNTHFAEYYIRRVNIEDTSPLCYMLDRAGYKSERNAYSKTSFVYEFPMRATGPVDLTAVQQLQNVLTLQANWSDNMVSNTIVFDDDEVEAMIDFVDANKDKFKSLSFLRRVHGYEQAPLTAITADIYAARMATLRPLDLTLLGDVDVHDTEEAGCESGKCDLVFSA